ncbi:hypothetical protein ACNO7O_08660, partial [Bisgaard Taxon 45]
ILSTLLNCTSINNLIHEVYKKRPDSKVVKQALASNANEEKTARIRIYSTINKPGYSDFYQVTVIKKGRKYNITVSENHKNNISLGMPKTELYENILKNNKTFGEYIIPANSPVILGFTDSKNCNEAWLFNKCNIYTFQRYFIPEAGQDYEILNEYHVYKISSNKKPEKIDSTGEIVSSYEE